MKIVAVEAIPFSIPLRQPVGFATGRLTALDHVLVRVRSEDGIVGTAEAPARPMVYGESPASIVHCIRDWFAPLLVGADARDGERHRYRLAAIEHNPTAKGAVDMALADLVARSLGQPLHKLLGGFADTVEVSHILGLGAPEAVAEQAVELRERLGIRTFKLKAGIDPDRDTAMLAAVRGALGPAVRLHVDCNHGYDSQTAARVVPRWEEFDVAWVEEPCPGWDVRGRRIVADATRIPLMADESAIDVAQIAEEIRRETCRFVCVKTARTGFSTSRRIVHLCEAAGIHTVVGSQGDTDLGAVTAAQFQAAHRATAHWPGELTFFLDAADGLLTTPPDIRDGRIALSDGPGSGVEIDDGKLARYRLDA